jgi:D-sedoheptulose 7-phosphate isomerase
MELREILNQHLLESSEILKIFSTNEEYLNSVTEAAEIIISSLQSGNKIITAGNGGSMCDAMHFASELSGRYRDDRDPIPAISISDPSHITCVGNDYGYDQIFSRYLTAHCNRGDIFFGITTSGNSQNIINACLSAKERNMRIVVLTSDRIGTLQTDYRDLVDVSIKTPSSKYADRIQELHIKIIHSIVDMVEKKLFKIKQN